MRLSVRNIMVGLFGALTLVIFGLMGSTLVQSSIALSNYSKLAELAEFDQGLFDSLMAMRSERGGILPAMKLDTAAALAGAADATKRKATDDAFAATSALAQRIGSPDLQAAAAPILADYAKWQGYRTQVDGELNKAIEARNAPLAQEVVDLGAKVLADLEALSGKTEAAINALDPAMTQLTQVRSLGWAARSIAGTGNTTIVNALAANEPVTPEKLISLDVIDAQVNFAWATITNLVANPETPKEILDLYKTAQATYFGGDFAAQRAAAIAKFEAGEPAGIAIEKWREYATPAQATLANLSSESLKFMTDMTAGNLAAAWLAIAGYGVATLLVAALCVLGILAIIFRVANPISLLTAVMDTLASGNNDVVVPSAQRKDEIGEMARAVEVFRQNGIRIAALNADEAERNKAVVSRAEMMNTLQAQMKDVVSAASAGDFSQRVRTDFPVPELNDMGSSVNGLVETIDRGLAETGDVLSALASADLTRRVQGRYQGAFERLKADTNQVAEKLSETISGLRQTSRALKSATGEILAGANDLSERTTKQAATIEETSAAMEQLATTVMQNAERAKQASAAAGSVTRTAEEGGAVMAQANDAMERIRTSSSKISNIIGMIDDIAFQTNLLALNASVEAARAGEAGKGFAVVAVEVRRLAQSSAEASSEVKALIEQSAVEVGAGSKLVADAAAKLGAMVDSARSTNELMEGIAKDSREQSTAIDEVAGAVRQMDEMTQHNAALVEETNAAIEQTESQANDLDRIVDVFRLGDAAPTAAYAPAAQRRGPVQQAKAAAGRYLNRGNAAVKQDWSEF